MLFADFSPNEGQTAPKEYFKPDYRPSEGVVGMAIIPGITLEQKWDGLVDEAKSQSAFNSGVSSQRFERSLAYKSLRRLTSVPRIALYPRTRCWKIYKCQLDHF